ncbi:MAG TPA: glycosyltransferase, partial [Nevskiales bacterium]|nr:glycosyltransferase [Nevskiales bacterium]
MRVALVITRGDDVGGANVHVRDLALGLRDDGHTVCVLAGGEGVFADMLRALDIPVVVLPHLGRALRPWQDLRAFFEILRALRDFRPDIVSTHSSKAGWLGRLAARLLGLPSVFTAHGWAFSDGVPLLPRRVYRLAEKLAAAIGDHVIAVSEYDRRLALDLRVTRPGRITTVHNGIPTLPQTQGADCMRQPPTLLMVARFAPQKDHATLLRALESLPPALDWRLRLVGDGP